MNMKIAVLGCGFHGRGIAYQLAGSDAVELRVLDRDASRAAAVGDKAGVPWQTTDVTDDDRCGRRSQGPMQSSMRSVRTTRPRSESSRRPSTSASTTWT